MGHSHQGREEIIVIGGGIIGCSVAWTLSVRGHSVRILERAEPGGLASHAAAGILGPFNETGFPGPFLDLLRQSLALYPAFTESLISETGLSPDFTRSGILSIGFGAMDREELLRRFDWQSPLDPTIAFCEAKEARRLEPALTGPFDSAIHYPSEGHVFAPRLVKALLGALSRRSIPLDQGITVSKVAPTGSGTFTLTDRAGGTWEAEKVVLAAGSLLSSILLPPPEIRITPVNGQILAVRSPGSYYRKVVFYPPHGYFVPKMDGTVVIGATEEKIGTRTRVTPAGLMEFLAPLSELSPDILALPLHHTWSGLRPRSDDGFPVMGPHPECPGLFFAAGHYRNGILLAPVTGQILADAIEGRISDAVRPFLPDRLTAASFS